MAQNKGKEFELRVRKDWLCISNTLVLRLPDQQSGYFGTSANPCDFICYNKPNLFMLEVKTHKGNTFPFSSFRQFDKLESYFNSNIDGLHIGVILWMYEHGKVIYIPMRSFISMRDNGVKSFNIKYLESQEYECFELPSKISRTYPQVDYSFLINLANSNEI